LFLVKVEQGVSELRDKIKQEAKKIEKEGRVYVGVVGYPKYRERVLLI